MNKLAYVLAFATIVLAGAFLAYGAKLYNNATTPIVVTEVEKGVKCASMVTKDGVSLSCWKI